MKIPTSPQKPRTSQRTTAVGKEAAVQWTHRQTKDLPPTVLDHSEELLKPAPQDASSGMKRAAEAPSAQDYFDYQRDFFERTILFWDTLRQRANNMLEHERAGLPPLLDFKYETLLDARSFERSVNYALLRITEIDGHCWDDCVDPDKPPVIVVDPRAGHGPGIGGFKRDSEVGMAMREGHPVYFVIFFPEPTLGQTLADVLHVLRRFAEEVAQRHPGNPPVLYGNCQAGWALTLELKLLADVGLVGFPNVGKSTLLSVTSNAHPKIANYHFTTLFPNLGVIYVEEGVSFVMADIPGIIEGAAEGAGLGHDFLRHIDRCRLLVHIVDVSGSEDRDPIEDFQKINEELRQYSADLAERPMIVAANKIDLLPPDSDNLERLRAYVTQQGYEFYEISAATTAGTKQLMRVIAGKLSQLPPVTVYEPDYVKPLAEAGSAEDLQIEPHGDVWIVSGPWLLKLLNDINFEDYESRMYFDRQLRKSGIFDRLEEQGIQDGDTVSIYDYEFEYTK
jgi:Obg family GTPase CgtA-like protein